MGIYVLGQWPGMLAVALTIIVSSLAHFQHLITSQIIIIYHNTNWQYNVEGKAYS